MEDNHECFVDTFTDNVNPNIEYMRAIISRPHEDPNQHGFWEMIVRLETGDYMRNLITRGIRFAAFHGPQPLVILRFIFFVMVGTEHGVRQVIRGQLQRAGNEEKLAFFDNVFAPFAQSAYDSLVEQPFEHFNVSRLLLVFTAVLQTTWLTRFKSCWVLQKQHQDAANAEAERIITENKKKKQELKLAQKNKRRIMKSNASSAGLDDDELDELGDINDFI